MLQQAQAQTVAGKGDLDVSARHQGKVYTTTVTRHGRIAFRHPHRHPDATPEHLALVAVEDRSVATFQAPLTQTARLAAALQEKREQQDGAAAA